MGEPRVTKKGTAIALLNQMYIHKFNVVKDWLKPFRNKGLIHFYQDLLSMQISQIISCELLYSVNFMSFISRF